MSISQRAVILIRLDGRRGEFVPVADLAEHMALAEDVVRERINELWHEGWVQPQWDTMGERTVLVGAMAVKRLPTCG